MSASDITHGRLPSWSASLSHINDIQLNMLDKAEFFAGQTLTKFGLETAGGDDSEEEGGTITNVIGGSGPVTFGDLNDNSENGGLPSIATVFAGLDSVFNGVGNFDIANDLQSITGRLNGQGPIGSIVSSIWGVVGGLITDLGGDYSPGNNKLCTSSFCKTSDNFVRDARDAKKTLDFPDYSDLMKASTFSINHSSSNINLTQPTFLTKTDIATFDSGMPTLADINTIKPAFELQSFDPNAYSVKTNFTQFSSFVPKSPVNPLTGLGNGPSLTLKEPFTLTLPPLLPLGDVSEFDIDDAPKWDKKEPDYDFSGQPGKSPSNWVGRAPAIMPVSVPGYEGASEPPEPSLLTIPDVPIRDPSLPNLYIDVEALPDFPELDGTVDYNDPEYALDQLARLESEVSRVLDGSLGVPDAIWEQIWSKALDQITRQGVAQKRQARRDWAKLGWSMPGGIALAGQIQAQHDINQQLSMKALEQATQRAIQEREDFWQAFQKGVAIEEIQIQLYNAQQERALKTALAQVESLVSVYNALVARSQAEVSRTQALVAAKELELRGALATLEVDKAKLDAAKIKGEINQLAVQIYVARWEAVKNAIEKWKVAVSTVDYQIEERKLGLARYGEELKAWLGELDGWAKEWDGYIAKIEGQKTIAQTYETSARVFSERMKGYSINAEAEKTRVESEISVKNMEIERYNSDIKRFQAGWEAIKSKLTADIGKYDIDARIFSTQAEQRRAHSQNLLEHEKTRLAGKSFMVDVEKAKAEVEATRVQSLATAYDAHMRGYAADLDGQTKIEAIKADIAQAMASVLGAKVQAYDAESRLRVGELDAKIRRHDVDTRLTESKLKAAVDERQVRVGYASAEAQNNSAWASFYGHAVNRANAKDDVNQKMIGHDLDLKRVNIEEAIAKVNAQAEKIKGLAAAANAMAAAANAEASLSQAAAARAAAVAETVKAAAAKIEAEASLQRVAATIAEAKANFAASMSKINADIVLGETQVKTTRDTAMAKINADWVLAQGQAMAALAAASLSSINISSSASASDSSSYSQGNSWSVGNSTSHTATSNLTPSTTTHSYRHTYAEKCCE